MTTTEGSVLIGHITAGGKFSDDQLARALMITGKRFERYKSGERETPRALTETLAILAEHVGYPTGSMTRERALKQGPNTHVEYRGTDHLVLGVLKTGVLAPYFSLLGPDGIHTGVPYRLLRELPESKAEAETAKKS